MRSPISEIAVKQQCTRKNQRAAESCSPSLLNSGSNRPTTYERTRSPNKLNQPSLQSPAPFEAKVWTGANVRDGSKAELSGQRPKWVEADIPRRRYTVAGFLAKLSRP